MRWAVTLKPSAAMRRGLSRMPWSARPKGDARDVDDREIGEDGAEQREVVEGIGARQSMPKTCGTARR